MTNDTTAIDKETAIKILLEELNKGRLSGEENGWLSATELRDHFLKEKAVLCEKLDTAEQSRLSSDSGLMLDESRKRLETIYCCSTNENQ